MRKGKQIIALLLCFLLTFQLIPTNVWAADNEPKGFDLLTQGNATFESKEAFQSLFLYPTVKKEENKQSVNIEFKLTLNMGFIEEHSSLEGGDGTEPAIGFGVDLELDEALFSNIDNVLANNRPLSIGEDVIGHYSVTKTSEGKLRLSVDMAQEVYTAGNIIENAGANLKIELQENKKGEAEVELEDKGGSVYITVTFPNDPGEQPSNDKDSYTLSKSQKEIKDSQTFVEYTLTATAEDGSFLNGLTLRDPIPEGLDVTKVFLNGDELLESDYTLSDGEFTYHFPIKDSSVKDTGMPGYPLKKATFKIQTRLSETYYKDYIQGKQKFVTFNNQAFLEKGTDWSIPSNPVSTSLEKDFMVKEGKRVGNSQQYEWTIMANTFFSGGKVYLIDMIDTTAQEYLVNGDKEIVFQINGATSVAKSATGTLTYEELQTNVAKAAALTTAGSVYYTIEKGGKKEQILIIPLEDEVLNKPLKVTYKTKMTAFKDSAVTRNVTNKVTMLWDNAGDGYGDWNGFHFEIRKTVNPGYSYIKKSGPQNPPKNGLIDWLITVNERGEELSNVVVTDVLNDAEQVLNLPANEKLLATLITTDDNENKSTPTSVQIPLKSTSTPGIYYELTKDDIAHTTTVTIHFNSIKANEQYVITLPTKVVDPNLLSQQGHNIKEVSNSVTLTANGNITAKGNASTGINNTLISKDAIKPAATVGSYTNGNYYDYENHLVYWQVTVNPNQIDLESGAVLTDTLPTGMNFGKLLKVTRNGTEGTISSDGKQVAFPDVTPNLTINLTSTTDWQAGESSAQDKSGTAVLTFNEAFSDTIVFTFTTVFDEQYRETVLKNWDLKKNYQIHNEVKLQGTVKHPIAGKDGVSFTASDDANHYAKIPTVAKKGKYITFENYNDYGRVARAEWEILINPDGINMEGVRLIDELKPHFELDQTSFQIQTVESATIHTTDDKNNITYEKPAEGVDVVTDNVESLLLNDTGFEFVIPKELAHTPLLVSFTTVIVDGASADQMANSVVLEWGDGKSTETEDNQASGSATVSWNDFASGYKLYLQVIKTSSKTTYVNNEPVIRLPDAEFTLTPMKESDGKWVEDTTQKPKVRKTNEQGSLNFMFLKQDVVYRLQETESPVQFYKDEGVQYFVFEGPSPSKNYPKGTTIVLNGQKLDGPVIVENTPQNAGDGFDFSFVKQADTGRALQGVEFTLRHEGIQAGQYAPKPATSAKNGMVVFQNVYPGTYTLTENSSASIQTIEPITVTVTAKGEGENRTADITMSGDAVALREGGGYIITNHYIRGSVILDKYDEKEQDTPVSGAEFTIYNQEDVAVARLIEARDSDGAVVDAGKYRLAPLPTDPKADDVLGKPSYVTQEVDGSYRLLAGSYYLVETTTPEGYRSDTDEKGVFHQHDFEITTQDQSVTITNGLSAEKFLNTPLGTIRGTKVIAGTNRGLAGAVIGLFPENEAILTEEKAFRTVNSANDGSFTFTDVPYGTYKIVEVKAPGNYNLNKTTIFTVTVGQNTSVITQDDSGAALTIENTRRRGGGGGGGGGGSNPNPPAPNEPTSYIAIQKTSEDGTLAGFTFRVAGDKVYRDATTDAYGRIMINDLPYGRYTISELATEAVVGKYILPDSQTVTLSEDGVLVEFENRLLPEDYSEIPDPDIPLKPGDPGYKAPEDLTDIGEDGVPRGPGAGKETYGPKTGYEGASPLWRYILGASVLGIGVSLFAVRKNKYKGRYAKK